MNQLSSEDQIYTWLTKPKIHGYTIDELIPIIEKIPMGYSQEDNNQMSYNLHVTFIVDQMNEYLDTGYYDFHTWNNIIFPYLQNCLIRYLSYPKTI